MNCPLSNSDLGFYTKIEHKDFINFSKRALIFVLLYDYSPSERTSSLLFNYIYLCATFANFYRRETILPKEFSTLESFSRDFNEFIQASYLSNSSIFANFRFTLTSPNSLTLYAHCYLKTIRQTQIRLSERSRFVPFSPFGKHFPRLPNYLQRNFSTIMLPTSHLNFQIFYQLLS